MGRAGTYRRQVTGYKAFSPSPLPPDPPVHFDDEMQELLSQADRALGRLDGSIQTLPNPDLFVFMYVRKEAVLSSQIEGTQSSINDLLKIEAHISDPNAPHDVGEVLNYVAAMNHGLQRLQTLPVSIRLIKEIHERLLHNVRGKHNNPGEIRTSQNWIGPQGSNLIDAIFVPPPPHEVGSHLGDLEKFIHSAEKMPILIRIGMIHAQFETIHPFLDGNGRVGRLLITFLLCHNEVLLRPVLYISHYFKQHRDTYYSLLQRTRDGGDWESWLKFFLTGIRDVSREATQTARVIVEMREKHRETIMANFGQSAANGLTILEWLYARPIVSVNEIKEKLKVSYPTANELVAQFTQDNILVEMTGQRRNRIFGYDGYIRLFSERADKFDI